MGKHTETQDDGSLLIETPRVSPTEVGSFCKASDERPFFGSSHRSVSLVFFFWGVFFPPAPDIISKEDVLVFTGKEAIQKKTTILQFLRTWDAFCLFFLVLVFFSFFLRKTLLFAKEPSLQTGPSQAPKTNHHPRNCKPTKTIQDPMREKKNTPLLSHLREAKIQPETPQKACKATTRPRTSFKKHL